MIYSTLISTVLFCLGLRIVSEEGNLLYFLRKPFEKAYSKKEYWENRYSIKANKYYKHWSNIYGAIAYIGKPLITCITCMSSVWGVTVFIMLNGFSEPLIYLMVLNSFAAAFIQTFIWSLYAKYIQ